MTNSITLGVVATPVVSVENPLYQDYLLVGDVLQKLEDGSATDAELAAGAEAQDRIETALAKAKAQQQEAITAECVAAEVAKNEQLLKVDAVIKKVEADIVARFRSGLAQRGGQRVLIDAVKARELASRFEVTAGRGDFSGALAALKALRQGAIAAGVMYHFGSVRNQDEFLYRAEEEVKRLRSELPHKKRGKRRT